MKNNSLILLYVYIFISLLTVVFPVACSWQDDDCRLIQPENAVIPEKQILDTFSLYYPEAKEIVWSTRQDYYVADFENESRTFRTWFTFNGDRMLEKINIPFNNLDLSVIESFKNTDYALWDLKGAFSLWRKGLEEINEISVERSGLVSNLYYTSSGNYIRVADGFREYSDSPVDVPEKLLNSINTMFDDPRIVDIYTIDVIDREIAAGVMVNNIFVTSVFFNNYEWIVNFWDLTLEQMPAIVVGGFQRSQYANYKLLYSRLMETASGISYLFYVDRDGKIVIAEFNTNGRLTTILSGSQTKIKYSLTR